MNDVLHWQLEDRTLACGSVHLDWEASFQNGDTVFCCHRDPAWVGCAACLQVARIAGLAA